MTRVYISCRRKGDWVTSCFTILILLYLLNGCATLGAESWGSQEMVPSVSNEGAQEAKGNEFILGPGDKLDVEVYRHDDLKKTIQIDNSGRIAYPLVGEIQAGGLTVHQLRNILRAGLVKYIVDPEVLITISSVRSQNVIVLGEVGSPGLFILDAPKTSLQVIAMAGGFTKNAKTETVLLIRGGLKEPKLITLNFKKVFNVQDLTQNVSLQSGDIIYVPVTKIENVSRYFDHLQRILATFYQAVFSGMMATNTAK